MKKVGLIFLAIFIMWIFVSCSVERVGSADSMAASRFSRTAVYKK